HDRAYEQFRPCLRWEFSFTCPFCLLHEAQVCPAGAAASSQYWIEHLSPQSERPELRNVYSNLVHACRRCNLARRYRPSVDSRKPRLLDRVRIHGVESSALTVTSFARSPRMLLTPRKHMM